VIIDQPNAPQAADIIAINHLAASYAEAMGRFAIEEAVQTYAEDGVLSSPTTEDAVGRAAIAEVIGRTVSGLDFVFQTVHQGMVSMAGDTAKATFPITEWARRTRDGRGILFLGVYSDDVVRTPAGWRFARRRLMPRTTGKPDFLTGQLHDLAVAP